MTQRNCRRFQKEFKTVRTAQLYCCRKCRVVDAVSRHRSDYTKPRGLAVAEKRLRGLSESPKPLSDDSTLVWAIHAEHHKLTHGALQGDEYQLGILRGWLSENAGLLRPSFHDVCGGSIRRLGGDGRPLTRSGPATHGSQIGEPVCGPSCDRPRDG